MSYKIINNLSTADNHFTRLKELFNESDSVVLTSPYLMSDFVDFLGKVATSTTKKIHLVTTLIPKSIDQIKKITSLVSLIEFPGIKKGQLQCQISLNNKLHGKIYIFKRDEDYISAIVSSANFTDSGLSRNHEWGIEIFDKLEISKLEKTILDSVEFESLSFEEIYALQAKTNEFLAQQPQAKVPEIELDLVNMLESPSWAKDLDDTIAYWLKPIGLSENPIKKGELFDKLELMVNFSKRKPREVKPNDILILYGVGIKKILSIYRATSYPTHVTTQQIEEADWHKRWPWYVTGHNLTQSFGRNWWLYNLDIYALVDQYLAANPQFTITASGGKSLGGFNFGHDKLKLAPDFAKFVLDQVVNINDNK